jgi:Uma2 family endonuclease
MAVHTPPPPQPEVARPAKRLFTVDEYYRMAEVGILEPEERLELIEGVIYVRDAAEERHFTVDEFQRMAEAGILRADERVELIDGEVVQMMVIGGRHPRCVRDLIELFEDRPRRRARLDVQNPVQLSDSQQLQPDVLLLRRRADGYRSLPKPEDVLLAIEVCDASGGTDRAVKVPLYARHGVRELWLVDLDADVVEVYRQPSADGYRDIQRLRRGDSVSPEALPDFTLAVDAILG